MTTKMLSNVDIWGLDPDAAIRVVCPLASSDGECSCPLGCRLCEEFERELDQTYQNVGANDDSPGPIG